MGFSRELENTETTQHALETFKPEGALGVEDVVKGSWRRLVGSLGTQANCSLVGLPQNWEESWEETTWE